MNMEMTRSPSEADWPRFASGLGRRQPDPGPATGLFDIYAYRLEGFGIDLARTVCDYLSIEVIGDDEGEVALVLREPGLESGRLQEPEQVVDIRSADAVRVCVHVSCVDGYAQLDPRVISQDLVVLTEPGPEVHDEWIYQRLVALTGWDQS
ncbi:MAG: hypothetical protein JO345_25700 [Streptosporangiaceae bacterium]|nr:hypothetical protein [Streptosporangiaceae bacterium]